MAMKQIKFEVPEDIIYSLNESESKFVEKIKLIAAIEFYKSQKLSLGKAAQLAGMDKTDFMFLLGKENIPVINYSTEELKEELEGFGE